MMRSAGEGLSDDDYRALHEFRYSIRRFERVSEEAARAVGLDPRQHQLMLAVRGLPEGMEPTVGNLAERLQIRHHTAVERVDRLVARGYAERSERTTDRRGVYVRLTEKGAAVLEGLSEYHRKEIRSLAPALVHLLRALSARQDPSEALRELDHATRTGDQRGRCTVAVHPRARDLCAVPITN